MGGQGGGGAIQAPLRPSAEMLGASTSMWRRSEAKCCTYCLAGTTRKRLHERTGHVWKAVVERQGAAEQHSRSQGIHSSPVVITPAAETQRALGPLSKGAWEGKRAEREHRHVV